MPQPAADRNFQLQVRAWHISCNAWKDDARLSRVFAAPKLERAIGVLYRPESERRSHYFDARLSEQFDFVLHVDETRAVEPLERTPHWEAAAAETYPSGL